MKIEVIMLSTLLITSCRAAPQSTFLGITAIGGLDQTLASVLAGAGLNFLNPAGIGAALGSRAAKATNDIFRGIRNRGRGRGRGR